MAFQILNSRNGKISAGIAFAATMLALVVAFNSNHILRLLDAAFPTPTPALTAPERAVANAQAAVGLDLVRTLSKSGGNVVVSPSSASTALAMTHLAAGGQTASELATLLKIGPDLAGYLAANKTLSQAAARVPFSTDVAIANVLATGSASDAPQKQYVAALKHNFSADVLYRPSQAAIDRWASRNTRGRIPNMPVTLPSDGFVLANAVYFKAPWQRPFAKSATKPLPFHLQTGQPINVPMMSRKAKFAIQGGNGFTALRMPYATGRFSMVVLLPHDKNSTDAMLSGMSSDQLLAIAASLKEQPEVEVDVRMPKFKIEASNSLKAPLQKLGIACAFEKSCASFPNLAPNLFADDVVQKIFVDLAEDGTEAAALTSLKLTKVSAELGGSTGNFFHVDRPFVFAIVDDALSVILFLGRIMNPVGETSTSKLR